MKNTENDTAGLAAAPGYAALVDWLKAEMLDDEAAMINARDNGECERRNWLEGHHAGLLHALYHIRVAQHNAAGELQPPPNNQK